LRNPLFSAAAALIIAFGYYFWTHHFNWYSDSFYTAEFEKYTDISLEGNYEVIWKWAAPRGFDGTSHYVTAAITIPGFNAKKLKSKFEANSNCYEKSGGAKQFLSEASTLSCWQDVEFKGAVRSFFVLYAAEEQILLFKKSTD